MELNNVINDNSISTKMKDIYRFIEKNDSKIDEILNNTFKDIKNIFSDVEMNDGTIELSNINVETIVDKRNECHSILSHHSKKILKDNSYLMSYAFKIIMLKNKIIIKKKH